LVKAHRKVWQKEFTAAGLKKCKFRRGFVERATLADGPRFLRKVDALFCRTTLRELAYVWDDDPRNDGDLPAWLEALLESPHAGRITELEAIGEEAIWLVRDLLYWPALNGLTKIRCTSKGHEGGWDTADALSEATHLTRLRHLTLWDISAALSALAGAAHLRSLEYLDVGDAKQGDDGRIRTEDVVKLADSPHLRRLRFLDLSGNRPIGPEGAEAIACSEALASLEVLQMVACEIEERGLLALAASETLTNLCELAVDVEPMSNETAQALVSSPLAGRIQRLSLHVWDGVDWFLDALCEAEVNEILQRGLGDRLRFEEIDCPE
jgi:hypothetical protein